MPERIQYCPLCKKQVYPNERYYNYVCADCEEKATDLKGEKVVYRNTGPIGVGCQGYYQRNAETEKYNSDICYIDNIQCYAEEGRFGGIVIRPCV